MENESIVNKRHENCWSCRLVSGFGVVGMGIYIWSQAKHRPPGLAKNSIYTVSIGN